MGRAPCCDKNRVKKGAWSPEEDEKLKSYIEEHGTGGNWIALPQKIGLKRCGKSCRLRWLNYLRPNIKHGSFTEDEDRIICNLYISIGSRWSIIAAQLPGRTDNDIKNYWNTRLKKKLLGKPRDSTISQSRSSLMINSTSNDKSHVDQINGINRGTPTPSLTASALERMQLRRRLLQPDDHHYFHLGDDQKTLIQTQELINDADPMICIEKHSSMSPDNYMLAGIESTDDQLGFHPSLQISAALISTKDYEIPNYDLFAAAGIHEDQQGMDGMYCNKESMDWWLGNGSGVEEEPSPESWESADSSLRPHHDALLGDYVQQLYDL